MLYITNMLSFSSVFFFKYINFFSLFYFFFQDWWVLIYYGDQRERSERHFIGSPSTVGQCSQWYMCTCICVPFIQDSRIKKNLIDLMNIWYRYKNYHNCHTHVHVNNAPVKWGQNQQNTFLSPNFQ